VLKGMLASRTTDPLLSRFHPQIWRELSNNFDSTINELYNYNNLNLTFQSPHQAAVKSIDPLVPQKQNSNVSYSLQKLGICTLRTSTNKLLFVVAEMKHLAAYLLLALGGNSSPSAKDITKVLASVGVEPDTERLEILISELKGKDLQEV
jgi:hypothetical protein